MASYSGSGDYNDSVIHAGNLSYTEDKILIYTLYVSNFPSPVDEDKDKLLTYLEKFGAVSNLSIQTRFGNRRAYRFGFVTFSEPESASKALRAPDNTRKNQTCYLRPADSWKQPYLDKRYQVPCVCDSEEEENKNVSILNLNNDVFFLIFQYLPFNEQIKLSTICVRFQQIFKKIYAVQKLLDIDLGPELNLMDFRIGLQEIGESIHRIKFHSNSKYTIKNFAGYIGFLSEFCVNLKYLQLDALRFQYKNIYQKISEGLKTIEVLVLRNCSITDSMLNFISKIKTIKDLDLTKNFELTGQHLHRFRNLERLILNDCINIYPKYFVQMCTKTQKLQTLNIRNCKRLDISTFQAMVINLTNLSTLTISTCYYTNEIEKLAELESLKHLTINVSIVMPDKFLQKLSQLKHDQLETLIITDYFKTLEKERMILKFMNLIHIELPFVEDLHGDFLQKLSQLRHLKILRIPGCINITELDLLNLIETTYNIQEIDISQTRITNNFIQQLCDVFSKINRWSPLTLIVGSTLIKKSIKNDPRLIEHKKKLKILFRTSCYGEQGHYYDYENDFDDEKDA